MTRVKICGITRAEDAELAVELGAWAIGFIQHPPSKRFCDPAMAAGIARRIRRRVALVGVFVNAPLDEVAWAAESIGLTHLQMHGDEGVSYCSEVGRRTGCKVIKAVQVSSGADIRRIQSYRYVDLHLLDAAGATRGGTGNRWDWSLAAQHRGAVPMLLSGGLSSENVATGIKAVSPWGVDVASGVEAEPGVKDPAKLEAFFAAVEATRPRVQAVADPGAPTVADPAPATVADPAAAHVADPAAPTAADPAAANVADPSASIATGPPA